jgi:hypothetical protein
MARRTRRTDDSKKWYAQFGYVVLAVLGIAYILVTAQNTSARATGWAGAGLILGLGLIGLTTYPALFKDAMFLSRSGYTWSPSWWKYIGFGLLTPVGLYYALDAANLGPDAGGIAIISFSASTVIMNVVYLYHRHERIGRP